MLQWFCCFSMLGRTCGPSKERILAHWRLPCSRERIGMHGIVLEDMICGGHQGAQILVRHVRVTTVLVLGKGVREHVESFAASVMLLGSRSAVFGKGSDRWRDDAGTYEGF